jgi:hypothetical protein
MSFPSYQFPEVKIIRNDDTRSFHNKTLRIDTQQASFRTHCLHLAALSLAETDSPKGLPSLKGREDQKSFQKCPRCDSGRSSLAGQVPARQCSPSCHSYCEHSRKLKIELSQMHMSLSFPGEVLGADKSAVRVSRGYLFRGSATLSRPALNTLLIGPNR